MNFYPRPPRGGRRDVAQRNCMEEYFYPRPPRGGRLSIGGHATGGMVFLSTPSARRATCPSASGAREGSISIHALREEGDGFSSLFGTNVCDFYPRPPRGGRLPQHSRWWLCQEFLSTPSARRATSLPV